MAPWRRSCHFFQVCQSIVKTALVLFGITAWSVAVNMVEAPKGTTELSIAARVVSSQLQGGSFLPQFPGDTTADLVRHATLCAPMLMSAGRASKMPGCFPVLFIIIHTSQQTGPAISFAAMAPHSSTLAWKIPWMEEPGRLQSMRSLGVGHDWTTSLSLFTSFIWKGNGNPLQCSCLENPRNEGAWWAAVYGVAQSQTRLKQPSSSSSNSAKWRPGAPVWTRRRKNVNGTKIQSHFFSASFPSSQLLGRCHAETKPGQLPFSSAPCPNSWWTGDPQGYCNTTSETDKVPAWRRGTRLIPALLLARCTKDVPVQGGGGRGHLLPCDAVG